MTMDAHLTLDQLADYHEHTLPAAESRRIEAHLTHCPECRLMAREMHAFNRVWDAWSIESHVAAYQRARLSGALEELRSRAPAALQERLGRWLEQWPGKAAGAVRVILEASKDASRVLSEGLEPLTLPGSGLQFAPVRRRGAVAVRAGGAVVPTRGGAARGRGVVPSVRVDVRREREVTVEATNLLPGRAPLVVLVPLEEGISPKVAALELVGDPRGRLIAKFADLPLGEYVVAFEPTAQPMDAP